jgi:tetratricopeptide (TPR) repeat protein
MNRSSSWRDVGAKATRASIAWLGLAVAGTSMFTTSAHADTEEPARAEANAASKGQSPPNDEQFKPPLEALPELPARQFAAPSADDRTLLDGLLNRLTSTSDTERQSAASDLSAVSESLVPAIFERINREAQGADRGAMKQLLLDTRRQVREQLEREHKGKIETPDYLQMVVSEPRLGSPDWKRLTTVLTLSRMCAGVGTVEALRALIHVYVRFEFLRIDTQLQLARLGEKALPALLEATHHQAPQVAEWAKQQLDFLGRAIPSEAVRVTSGEALADILRAYGYIRDPDAARLVLSFASSERSQVRLAARQAIRSYGATAVWVLRDAYEQTLGTKPSREWSWDRVARELFREYDRNRLAEVYEYYTRGVKLLDASKVDEALTEFEGLLRRSPDFTPSDKIVTAIFEFAGRDPEERKDWDRVERLLQAATRLGNPEQQASAHSLLATVAARRLAARGIADQFLLRQALDLHKENAQAERLLEELEKPALAQRSGFHRWFWPSALGGLSLVFAGLLFRTRRAEKA